MNSVNRIAARYVFESRGGKLVIGELVTLQIPIGASRKEVIAAKVSCQVGTQYGFQFTALSAEQRLGIQEALKGQREIPYRELRS
jgi:hypothetical protein